MLLERSGAPAFHSLVVMILALGIASSVAVFSLVDAILVRPLPYRDPQKLVMLNSFAPKPPFDSNGSLSYNDFLQFKAKAKSFSDLALTFRTGWSRVVLNSATEPVAVQGAFVSPNLFKMFGRSPVLGRTFTSDENLHAERVVVISHGLWAQRFGSSARAVGQDLVIGHDRWRVSGVMPSDFQVPFLKTQLWAPVLSHPEWNDTEETNPLERARWDVMARLKPGVSLGTAQAEVNSIERGFKGGLTRISRQRRQGCTLARTLHRQRAKEFACSFWQCGVSVAHCGRECCQSAAGARLATRAGVCHTRRPRGRPGSHCTATRHGGVGVFVWRRSAGDCCCVTLVPLLKALSPPDTPLLDFVSMNVRGLVFASLVSVTIGLLLGTVPAWRPTRKTSEALNTAERNSTEPRRSRRFKSVLVAMEFAVAMVLLTGAGLLIRSFVAVISVNPGFQTERVLTIQIGLPNNTPPSRTTQFYDEALQRIATLPGVQTAGGISNLFFLHETRTHALRVVEGHPAEPRSAWTPLVWAQISGDYFRAMGIPLLHGRFFNRNDLANAPPVAIVNEALAHRYWPHENPVGKRLKGFDPRGRHDDWLTVVGVVGNTRSGGLERSSFSQIYEVQAQSGEQIGNLVVRTATDPGALAASIRTLLHSLNRNLTVFSIFTMEQLLGRQEVQRRFQTWLVGVFSCLALALAALGVFATMHYSVTAKKNEIGIRMALALTRAISLGSFSGVELVWP